MGPNIPSRVALPLLGSNQDSPDPERIPEKSIFRQRVITPRVRVVRCREEKPKNRTLSDLTKTETMSVSSLKTTLRSALASGEVLVRPRSIEQRQTRGHPFN